MSSMREKIARAIYYSKPRNRPYEVLGQHARQYEKQADAVLSLNDEPELTCPHIDAALASGALSNDVRSELDLIRNINSQLRYSTWALRAMIEAARSER